MNRVANAVPSRARRKAVVAAASGYWGRSKNCFRLAYRMRCRALAYQYRDRRQLKRVTRGGFIQALNAWSRANGMKYSELMHKLKLAKVSLNRKILADLACNQPQSLHALLAIQ